MSPRAALQSRLRRNAEGFMVSVCLVGKWGCLRRPNGACCAVDLPLPLGEAQGTGHSGAGLRKRAFERLLRLQLLKRTRLGLRLDPQPGRPGQHRLESAAHTSRDRRAPGRFPKFAESTRQDPSASGCTSFNPRLLLLVEQPQRTLQRSRHPNSLARALALLAVACRRATPRQTTP